MKWDLYIVNKGGEDQTPWLTPVIPATQKAEIGRIEVQGQSRQDSLLNK
jgi:hypothetical protein